MYRDAGCKNVDYFQTGYDQKYFYRKTEVEREELRKKYNHDIVFCASNPKHHAYPDVKIRERIVLKAHGKYKDEFCVYGYFWEKHNLEKSWRGALNFYEQNDIYNGSKIILSVSCYNDVKKYFSNRLPIALATGTMVISKYFPGIEEYFENHKHLVWFKEQDECFDLIDYYLKHDEEREQIGKNGAQEVLLRHTYFERVKELSYRLGFQDNF
jgi:spore maturation protein CgeB